MTGGDDDLGALIAEVRRRSAPAEPPPQLARHGGEADDAWRARVAAVRAGADERAVHHRRVVNESARTLFGRSVADLLPAPTPGLRYDHIQVAIKSLPAAAVHLPLVEEVDTGAPPLAIRTTSPAEPRGRVIYLHGGGFWMGGGEVSSQIDRALIDHLASAGNVEVLNLDYRLAPEHPYPASVVDVLAAIAWTQDDSELPVGLVGVSSGANIAVVAARALARTAGSPPLSSLGLLVPSVALSDAPPALRDDEAVWAARMELIRAYTGPSLPPADPWISPSFEPRLEGLPDTLIVLAQHDEVAMGGERLATAIRAGGTTVVSRAYPMTHTLATPDVEAAMIGEVATFVARSIGHAPA